MAIVRALIARIQGLFAWWIADIRRRPSTAGKAISLLIGLFVLCCACSVGLAAVRGTGQAIGIVATNTPTLAPTNTPPPTATPPPTDTPVPTETLRPTIAPTSTEVPPTAAPTSLPTPTKVPAPVAVASTPRPAPRAVIGVAPQGSDCPADHPIKGNVRQRNPNKGAKIYHVPGDNGYAQTNPERCFATTTDAEAAGYRPVQR